MDSDSFLISVDNHASTRMTKNVNNFIGPLRPKKKGSQGDYVGTTKLRGDEIVKCKIEDNDGKVHAIIIHDKNYAP